MVVASGASAGMWARVTHPGRMRAFVVVPPDGKRRRMLIDERTTVGLDVHARSVVAEAVDWSSRQEFSRRLAPAPGEVLGWVTKLPGPVAVTYEAGPTGFGLARAFAAAGIRCVVVAPSKPERPLGADRDPVGCHPRDRDLDRVRAGSRDRGLGPVHRRQYRCLPGPGPQQVLQRGQPPPGVDHQDR